MRRRTVLALPVAATVPLHSAPAPSANFKLGSITYRLLQDWDVETIITKLEAVGFAAVELRTTHKHGVEPSLPAAEREKVRQRFARSNVRLVGFGTTCRFQSPDPAERQKELNVAKQFVDLAADTGAIGIKLHPLGFAPGTTRQESIGWWGQNMHALGDYGAQRKVEIWMEVHGKETSDPPVAAAMLKAANHPNVGAVWNSNETDVANGSIRESFALLKPWIRHVHIHELAGTSYPYAELFKLLREAGYRGYTMAECPQSKEPERFLPYYAALWRTLAAPCG